MKKVLSIVLVIASMNMLISCGNQKKSEVNNDSKNFEFEILEEKKLNEIKQKDLYLEYDYEIKNVEPINEVLVIEVEAKIENEEGFYALGKFISEYVKLENKAKLDLYGVEKINVIFNKDWLYDQTDILKKIRI